MGKLIFGIAFLIAPLLAMSQEPKKEVHTGIVSLTGNQYVQMPQLARIQYVSGVVDGMLFAPVLAGRDLAFTGRIENCFRIMKPDRAQHSAIVDRFLQQNPALLGYGMDSIVFWAISRACDQVGAPLR